MTAAESAQPGEAERRAQPAAERAASPAAAFSLAILTEFARLGATDAVVSPGSRSQALALVLAEFDRARILDLQVRLDERSAAFTALGFGVETARPALVVTTSGTAVANLLPAVLEASHSNVPIIVITSDRPDELRGTGSNQTTWQPGIFGRFVRAEFDVAAPVGADGEADVARDIARRAWAAAQGAATEGDARSASRAPGPVHVNLQLREPLSGVVPDLSGLTLGAPDAADRAAAHADADADADAEAAARAAAPLELSRGPRTIVIAGHGSGPAPEQLAHDGGWPLVAEVSSGARFGRNLVIAYRELLADPAFGARVERAVVFGHPSLSREVPALLMHDDVEVVVVGHAADDLGVFNPGHRVSVFADRVSVEPAPGGDEERAWLREWVLTSRALVEAEPDDVAPPNIHAARSSDIAERREYRVNELAALRAPITRRTLGLAVWRATWPHDRLVVGASRLIRDLDRWAPGKKISVHSNRGLAGIDGTIATATGVALASQRTTAPRRGIDGSAALRSSALAAQTGITRVLLGDLTLLHDVGGLLFGRGETRPRLQLVVGNDGGGTIFDTLEVAGTADRAAFDRVMNTPQSVDLAALAAAYGWAYSRAATRSELDRELTAPVTGPSILEVPLDR